MHAEIIININNANFISDQKFPILPELINCFFYINIIKILARETAAFVLQKYIFNPANFQLTKKKRETWFSGLEISENEIYFADIINLFRFVITF